jgi:hypothetical protein
VYAKPYNQMEINYQMEKEESTAGNEVKDDRIARVKLIR